MKKIETFKVLMLDHHGDIIYNDIMPHLLASYRSLKPAKRPKDFDALIEFIDHWATYHFWSRCEWEFLMESWPPNEKHPPRKTDIYEQIKMNIELVAVVLLNSLSKPPFKIGLDI